ncbi:hypothetical protein T440DRAFT_424982 [Plenodomus tracheiphilus IPT5]|uniref:Protein kinase domain-containing protein n=1 Tax=Plenodomus tracheiphilus IPT5 TaxID=1408161 RepID=A0A6A7B415_9PLEO|nr:hypothetical protein T440DRAFT_424982 [Plenodomus tracheiphilus IPT5]
MEQTSENPNKTHILHFFYDEEDSSALTVLINDVRFHIIVDPKDLQKSREKPLYYEYLDKISALREAEEREEEAAEEAQSKSLHGKTSHDGGSSDSGIDVTADDEDDNAEDEDQDSASAGVELRNWILSGFADIVQQCAPPNREPEEVTLHGWYHGPTYFYNMTISSGVLTPVLLDTTPDLTTRITALVPKLKMPKYIQNYSIPWLHPSTLLVDTEVDFPEPAHPGKVTHNETGQVYFFKPVVSSQPTSTKREIQILHHLANLNLSLKAPNLLAFVSHETSKTEIMGFLLSHIASPRPLTKLLDANISATLRDEWAHKSQAYVEELHKHDIVWGDAKADNFMVDGEDELWMIDFGGSYTEGWVDAGLAETREGDHMGVGKVVKALEEEGNVFDARGQEIESGSSEDLSVPREVVETASGLFVTERRAAEEQGGDEEDMMRGSGENRKREAGEGLEEGVKGGKRKRGNDEAEIEKKKSKTDDSEDEYTPEAE